MAKAKTRPERPKPTPPKPKARRAAARRIPASASVLELAAAVARSPWDLELQRIYADILLEQGGEHAIRGELVTLALSGKSPKVTEPRRVKLAKQLEQILADDDLDQRVVGGFVGAWTCTTEVLIERYEGVFADEPLLRELEIQLGERDLEAQIHVIAAIPQLARIHRLTLVGHQHRGRLSPQLLEHLFASPHFPRLEALALLSCSIRDRGAWALASARKLSALRELDLTRNELGSGGVRWLAASSHLTELRRLVLAHNRLRNDGVSALARTVFLTKLEHVDLSFTLLVDDDFTELVERFPNAVVVRR